MTRMMRYKVVSKVFVNGHYYDPRYMTDPYIEAPAGQKGKALEPAGPAASDAALVKKPVPPAEV